MGHKYSREDTKTFNTGGTYGELDAWKIDKDQTLSKQFENT